MSANPLPTCTKCNYFFTPDKGDIDDVDNNTGVCDSCDEVAKKVTIVINDPMAAEAVSTKLALAARLGTCIRKAAKKNGTIHISDKAARAEASVITRKDRKQRKNERFRQIADKRYRCRATYSAAFEVATAMLPDVPLPGDSLPIYEPYVLHDEEDNLAEIGEIIGVSDVTGLTVYDSIGTYARESFVLAK